MPERYLYVTDSMTRCATFEHAGLAGCTERHLVALEPPVLAPGDPLARLAAERDITCVVVGMERGYAPRGTLGYVRAFLNRGCSVLFHWPMEGAVERIDAERLEFYRRLRWVFMAFSVKAMLKPYYHLLKHLARQFLTGQQAPLLWPITLKEAQTRFETEVQDIIFRASPPRLDLPQLPSKKNRIDGWGAYFRLDFWAQIESGGSYGHTVYVAKALADVTARMRCLTASPFRLLDTLGVPNIVLRAPGNFYNEYELLIASHFYYLQLRSAFFAARPAYIYERLVLGNYVAAKLSQEFGVPYIVEYNGSEISMAATFGGHAYSYEAQYLKAEEAAFRQATLISVISEHVKTELVRRGMDSSKILVNPNGVDPEAYRPPTASERAAVRASLGFDDSHRVVCFTGTFGGWHGIEVLAQSLAPICESDPSVRFLLIGDGHYKQVVDDAIARDRLQEKVICTGRVPQTRGAELMRAADIFVSPHSSHMVDSRFFGSPTKLFEYMGIGRAIVASDLEQIGEVLRPAFMIDELGDALPPAGNRRSVLVEPGNVAQFVRAVTLLIKNPTVADELGENARKAALANFTWDRHVENLWRFVQGELNPACLLDRSAQSAEQELQSAAVMLEVDDRYKTEAQKQWNTEHCGAAYATDNSFRSRDWFLEVEAYRYGHYAPWMPEVMEFARHTGHRVLEIGGGLGTDLAQFASAGADVTDLDLADGHLELARENFRLRGLRGEFVHHDGESLPFPDASFDVVYSNGVIHHTPNTARVVREMYRVLKPGGRAIVMVYAENSFHFWRQIVVELGVMGGLLRRFSIGEIMSRHVELSRSNARPLVKVYNAARLRSMFRDFGRVRILKRQLLKEELPRAVRWLPLPVLARLAGWNLVVKADKSH